ncbi:uncharacterized protein [Parasteatoda tepidariorum]|uniref:uncharacterized protein n=1 Tax=Parasteatoda tepidariorum TaxID=114398 RepID=UPI0039BC4384
MKQWKNFGIPLKLINLTKTTLRRVKCRVKLQNELTEPFYTDRGLRQGDTHACLLLNIALEKAIRAFGINVRGTIFQRSTQILAYADDLDIMGRSRQSVVENFKALEVAAMKFYLANEDDYDDIESEDEAINEIAVIEFGGSEEPGIVENISAQPLGDEVFNSISAELDVKYDEYGCYVEADCIDGFVAQTQTSENFSVALAGKGDEYGFYVESDVKEGLVEENSAYENDENIGGDQIVKWDEYGFFVESDCIRDFVAQNRTTEDCENNRVTYDVGGSGEPGMVENVSDEKHSDENFQSKREDIKECETNLNGEGGDCTADNKIKKKGFWSSLKNLFCSCCSRK